MDSNNLKVGDKVKVTLMHGFLMTDVDAVVYDVDRSMVAVKYLLCGRKLDAWVSWRECRPQ